MHTLVNSKCSVYKKNRYFCISFSKKSFFLFHIFFFIIIFIKKFTWYICKCFFWNFFQIYSYLFLLAIFPQGFFKGCFVFARPPLGWSTGFIAMPRTLSIFFFFLIADFAFPYRVYLKNLFDTLPNIQSLNRLNLMNFFDGRFIAVLKVSFSCQSILQNVPAASAIRQRALSITFRE